MDVHAKLRHLRMSPRKVRLIANLISGLNIETAQHQLQFNPKLAAWPLLKLLNSAVANAENNHKLEKSSLVVKSVIVNQGPTLKRFRPRAFGRAAAIRKRSSHIILTLTDKKSSDKATKVSAGDSNANKAPVVAKKDIKHKEPVKTKASDEKKSKEEPRTRTKRMSDKIVNRQGTS